MMSFTTLASQAKPSYPPKQSAGVVKPSAFLPEEKRLLAQSSLKNLQVNSQSFKTPVIQTKEEVYVAADEVLTHPYFTPVHATVYGTIAGVKAGLLISPLVVGAAYLQEKIWPSQHFSFPFQDAIIGGLDNSTQKDIKKQILANADNVGKYELNALQHVVKMGMTSLYTVGLSALVFGGVVGLLIQANAQMKIAHIRRTIYNENLNQTESVPEDKLVSHLVHHHHQDKEDALKAYKDWSSDLSTAKDAAVNGFLSATTAKLITLVPKLAIGTVLGLTIGAFQTLNQYRQFQSNEPFHVADADFPVMIKVDSTAAEEKVRVTSTTKSLSKQTVQALETALKLATDKKSVAFFKERFAKQLATKAVTDSLLHLAAPAFWLGFLVVPPLVAVQLTDFFRTKIGIVPPNHYHHFHLTNWLKRWSYAKDRTNALAAGKQVEATLPKPATSSISVEKKQKNEASTVASPANTPSKIK